MADWIQIVSFFSSIFLQIIESLYKGYRECWLLWGTMISAIFQLLNIRFTLPIQRRINPQDIPLTWLIIFKLYGIHFTLAMRIDKIHLQIYPQRFSLCLQKLTLMVCECSNFARFPFRGRFLSTINVTNRDLGKVWVIVELPQIAAHFIHVVYNLSQAFPEVRL